MNALHRYFLQLSYNGTGYHGWQIQPNAVTVQELLDKALSTLLRQPVETTGCGRTDAGVHAREFFAHFDVMANDSRAADDAFQKVDDEQWGIEKTISHEPSIMNKTLKGLNALLPYDIAIKRIIAVHADAHARFDATLRSYEYHIHFDKDPFMHNFSWLIKDRPDVGLMARAATMLMEYTDFSCFSRSNTQVKTNNCKISHAEWVETENGLIFHISSDRFLRNMVRAIVGTLLMVGRKEIEPEEVRHIIESKDRSNAGTSVPACGLYLTEVKYPYL